MRGDLLAEAAGLVVHGGHTGETLVFGNARAVGVIEGCLSVRGAGLVAWVISMTVTSRRSESGCELSRSRAWRDSAWNRCAKTRPSAMSSWRVEVRFRSPIRL